MKVIAHSSCYNSRRSELCVDKGRQGFDIGWQGSKMIEKGLKKCRKKVDILTVFGAIKINEKTVIYRGWSKRAFLEQKTPKMVISPGAAGSAVSVFGRGFSPWEAALSAGPTANSGL